MSRRPRPSPSSRLSLTTEEFAHAFAPSRWKSITPLTLVRWNETLPATFNPMRRDSMQGMVVRKILHHHKESEKERNIIHEEEEEEKNHQIQQKQQNDDVSSSSSSFPSSSSSDLKNPTHNRSHSHTHAPHPSSSHDDHYESPDHHTVMSLLQKKQSNTNTHHKQLSSADLSEYLEGKGDNINEGSVSVMSIDNLIMIINENEGKEKEKEKENENEQENDNVDKSSVSPSSPLSSSSQSLSPPSSNRPLPISTTFTLPLPSSPPTLSHSLSLSPPVSPQHSPKPLSTRPAHVLSSLPTRSSLSLLPVSASSSSLPSRPSPSNSPLYPSPLSSVPSFSPSLPITMEKEGGKGGLMMMVEEGNENDDDPIEEGEGEDLTNRKQNKSKGNRSSVTSQSAIPSKRSSVVLVNGNDATDSSRESISSTMGNIVRRRGRGSILKGKAIHPDIIAALSNISPSLAVTSASTLTANPPSSNTLLVPSSSSSSFPSSSTSSSSSSPPLSSPPRLPSIFLPTLNSLVSSLIPFSLSDPLNHHIILWQGDPLQLVVDGIVNPTNEYLNDMNGLSGRIFRRGAHSLRAECIELTYKNERDGEGSIGCKTGDSEMTRGYGIRAPYIIHTVCPQWAKSYSIAAENRLHNCYKSLLNIAHSKGMKTLALPFLVTEKKKFPIELAAHIAFRTIRRWLHHHPDSTLSTIVIVGEDELQMDLYHRILPLYFPRNVDEESQQLIFFEENHIDIGNEEGEIIVPERQIRMAQNQNYSGNRMPFFMPVTVMAASASSSSSSSSLVSKNSSPPVSLPSSTPSSLPPSGSRTQHGSLHNIRTQFLASHQGGNHTSGAQSLPLHAQQQQYHHRHDSQPHAHNRMGSDDNTNAVVESMEKGGMLLIPPDMSSSTHSSTRSSLVTEEGENINVEDEKEKKEGKEGRNEEILSNSSILSALAAHNRASSLLSSSSFPSSSSDSIPIPYDMSIPLPSNQGEYPHDNDNGDYDTHDMFNDSPSSPSFSPPILHDSLFICTLKNPDDVVLSRYEKWRIHQKIKKYEERERRREHYIDMMRQQQKERRENERKNNANYTNIIAVSDNNNNNNNSNNTPTEVISLSPMPSPPPLSRPSPITKRFSPRPSPPSSHNMPRRSPYNRNNSNSSSSSSSIFAPFSQLFSPLLNLLPSLSSSLSSSASSSSPPPPISYPFSSSSSTSPPSPSPPLFHYSHSPRPSMSLLDLIEEEYSELVRRARRRNLKTLDRLDFIYLSQAMVGTARISTTNNNGVGMGTGEGGRRKRGKNSASSVSSGFNSTTASPFVRSTTPTNDPQSSPPLLSLPSTTSSTLSIPPSPSQPPVIVICGDRFKLINSSRSSSDQVLQCILKVFDDFIIGKKVFSIVFLHEDPLKVLHIPSFGSVTANLPAHGHIGEKKIKRMNTTVVGGKGIAEGGVEGEKEKEEKENHNEESKRQNETYSPSPSLSLPPPSFLPSSSPSSSPSSLPIPRILRTILSDPRFTPFEPGISWFYYLYKLFDTMGREYVDKIYVVGLSFWLRQWVKVFFRMISSSLEISQRKENNHKNSESENQYNENDTNDTNEKNSKKSSSSSSLRSKLVFVSSLFDLEFDHHISISQLIQRKSGKGLFTFNKAVNMTGAKVREKDKEKEKRDSGENKEDKEKEKEKGVSSSLSSLSSSSLPLLDDQKVIPNVLSPVGVGGRGRAASGGLSDYLKRKDDAKDTQYSQSFSAPLSSATSASGIPSTSPSFSTLSSSSLSLPISSLPSSSSSSSHLLQVFPFTAIHPSASPLHQISHYPQIQHPYHLSHSGSGMGMSYHPISSVSHKQRMTMKNQQGGLEGKQRGSSGSGNGNGNGNGILSGTGKKSLKYNWEILV